MKLEIFKNYDELSRNAAKLILETVASKPNAVLCLATGDSPLLTYQYVVSESKLEGIDFSQARFVGLDEWVGIAPTNPGSCKFYLNKNLFEPLHVHSSHIHLFDGLSNALDDECRKMDDAIKNLGGIDLMIVGVGVNGHIGFNEPGVNPGLYAHIIELEEITRIVGQKYFGEATQLSKGITLGLQHFLEARTAVVVANGEKKAAIIKKAIESPVSNSIPATSIRNHHNGLVYIDREAASQLVKN